MANRPAQKAGQDLPQQVVPLIERLLDTTDLSRHEVPPLTVARDQWGVVVLGRVGATGLAWAESLVRALRVSKACQGYAVEVVARQVIAAKSIRDLVDPSMGRRKVLDTSSAEKLRADARAFARRYGAQTQFEVTLRRPR